MRSANQVSCTQHGRPRQRPGLLSSKTGLAARGIRFCLVFALLTLAAAAGVIDRVAVVVGKTVITESEILDNLRVTAFLNGEPLDVSAAQRRAAADRLVDQQLLRNEMQVTGFTPPSAADLDRQLQQLIQRRFHSTTAFEEALPHYGITEQQVREQLQWQLAVVAFMNFRFHSETPPVADQSADRVSPGSSTPAAESVDQQLDNWLKEARTNTKVVFKEEAFQ